MLLRLCSIWIQILLPPLTSFHSVQMPFLANLNPVLEVQTVSTDSKIAMSAGCPKCNLMPGIWHKLVLSALHVITFWALSTSFVPNAPM